MISKAHNLIECVHYLSGNRRGLVVYLLYGGSSQKNRENCAGRRIRKKKKKRGGILDFLRSGFSTLCLKK